MKEKEAKSLVKMFKALAHPNRFRLFLEIVQESEKAFEEGHDCFANAIMDKLNVGAPTISHHLKELVNADLISTERKGKFLTCRVNPDAMARLNVFFSRT